MIAEVEKRNKEIEDEFRKGPQNPYSFASPSSASPSSTYGSLSATAKRTPNPVSSTYESLSRIPPGSTYGSLSSTATRTSTPASSLYGSLSR